MQNNDFDTIKKIHAGDINAFESLFKEHYQALCRYAFQYVRTKEVSEEIIQDLFFHLWKNKKELNIHTSLKAYLYKATYFNSLAYLRNEKIRRSFADNARKEDDAIFQDSTLEQKEINKIIDITLDKLPEKGRLIFTMSRFEGLKYREIAERLSISVKTVEANMGKALKIFRTNLRDYVGMFLL